MKIPSLTKKSLPLEEGWLAYDFIDGLGDAQKRQLLLYGTDFKG